MQPAYSFQDLRSRSAFSSSYARVTESLQAWTSPFPPHAARSDSMSAISCLLSQLFSAEFLAIPAFNAIPARSWPDNPPASAPTACDSARTDSLCRGLRFAGLPPNNLSVNTFAANSPPAAHMAPVPALPPLTSVSSAQHRMRRQLRHRIRVTVVIRIKHAANGLGGIRRQCIGGNPTSACPPRRPRAQSSPHDKHSCTHRSAPRSRAAVGLAICRHHFAAYRQPIPSPSITRPH